MISDQSSTAARSRRNRRKKKHASTDLSLAASSEMGDDDNVETTETGAISHSVVLQPALPPGVLTSTTTAMTSHCKGGALSATHNEDVRIAETRALSHSSLSSDGMISDRAAVTYTGAQLSQFAVAQAHPAQLAGAQIQDQLQAPQIPQVSDQLQLPQTQQTTVAGEQMPLQEVGQQMFQNQPAVQPRDLQTRHPPLDDVLLEKYEAMHQVGVGVYGTVYKAIHRDTRRVVAIKKMKTDEEYGMIQQGVPSQIIREVACLRDLIHPNVVELLDVHVGGGNENDYSVIFEYVEGDLHKLLKSLRNNNRKLGIELVQKYALELLTGIHACHVRLILHRDLKPQNILIGPNGLKIGDFGLSRMFSLPLRQYSLDVITLWYRAPEILLGCQRYGAEVDMWSAGCIVAEMATMSAIFNGDSEIGTIFKIFKICGTPSEATWEGVSALDHYKTNFPIWRPTNLKDIADSCPELGEDGMDLIRGLLVLAPNDRYNARKAKTVASQCMRSAI
mmetsp:Transcript_4167/g.6702  ORF Transcript_4167/g.6702 Transcript_4167/m.6702 type:complete len:504 (+) Transcript_4167:60-1571(+)